MDRLPQKWDYPRDASGKVTGPGKLSDFWKARLSSEENKKRKLAFIRDSFAATLNNQQTIGSCCQGNSKCESRFKATRLEMGDGSKFGGEYDEQSRSIRVSYEALMSYTYEEEIEGFILHELGHACDEAITFARIGSHVDPMDHFSRENAVARFDAPLLSCLERKAGAAKFDGHTALEAFAEGVFFRQRKHPLHWLSCRAAFAYNWPSECIFEVPPAKSQICAK